VFELHETHQQAVWVTCKVSWCYSSSYTRIYT